MTTLMSQLGHPAFLLPTNKAEKYVFDVLLWDICEEGSFCRAGIEGLYGTAKSYFVEQRRNGDELISKTAMSLVKWTQGQILNPENVAASVAATTTAGIKPTLRMAQPIIDMNLYLSTLKS